MGRLRILLAALAAAGLAACGEAPAPKPAAKGEAPKTAAVELRDVELTTTAEAVMEAVRQSTISAQIAGRVVDLRFDVGDYVKKGEIILRIDERSASQALAASEAQVLEAQACERGVGVTGAGELGGEVGKLLGVVALGDPLFA